MGAVPCREAVLMSFMWSWREFCHWPERPVSSSPAYAIPTPMPHKYTWFLRLAIPTGYRKHPCPLFSPPPHPLPLCWSFSPSQKMW